MKTFIIGVSLATFCAGVIVAIGAVRKWRLFVRPPDRIWIFKLWPYALMKGPRFNERFFAGYHLIGGIVISLVALALFFIALWQ